jgi:uncharacterized protein YndB with AHSA1/START domain
MDQQTSSHPAAQNATSVERKGERELVVTRTFDAPPRIVFKAWSNAEIFRQWWVPKGAPMTLLACDMDVRTGGKYCLEFAAGGQSMKFYGKYLDVVPGERIVWTNDEGDEEGAVTTVTFQDRSGKTLLTFHELYPTSEARDEAMNGAAAGLPTQLDQLAELLPTLGAAL